MFIILFFEVSSKQCLSKDILLSIFNLSMLQKNNVTGIVLNQGSNRRSRKQEKKIHNSRTINPNQSRGYILPSLPTQLACGAFHGAIVRE